MRKLLLTIPLCLAAAAGAAPLQGDALTIATSKRVVVFGGTVRISGALAGQPVGTSVFLYVQRTGDPGFVPVSTVTTGNGGAWSFLFEPTVGSRLQARSGENASPVVTVRVKPKLILNRRGRSLFTQAVAARSFRGRHVWFQRRSKAGVWRSLRKVVLDDPPRRFRAKLPEGVSRVRVSLPRRQAMPGYEPALSRVLVLRRS